MGSCSSADLASIQRSAGSMPTGVQAGCISCIMSCTSNDVCLTMKCVLGGTMPTGGWPAVDMEASPTFSPGGTSRAVCTLDDLVKVGTSHNASAAIIGLMSTNAPCGQCLDRCNEMLDKVATESCARVCTGGRRRSVCTRDEVMQVTAASNPSAAIVGLTDTNAPCGQCLGECNSAADDKMRCAEACYDSLVVGGGGTGNPGVAAVTSIMRGGSGSGSGSGSGNPDMAAIMSVIGGGGGVGGGGQDVVSPMMSAGCQGCDKCSWFMQCGSGSGTSGSGSATRTPLSASAKTKEPTSAPDASFLKAGVQLNVTIDTDYNTLVGNASMLATFKMEIVAEMARSLRCNQSAIQILSLRAGSTIVDVFIKEDNPTSAATLEVQIRYGPLSKRIGAYSVKDVQVLVIKPTLTAAPKRPFVPAVQTVLSAAPLVHDSAQLLLLVATAGTLLASCTSLSAC